MFLGRAQYGTGVVCGINGGGGFMWVERVIIQMVHLYH